MSFIAKIPGYIYYAFLSLSALAYPEDGYVVDVNGQQLHYYVRGERNGLPVVLLHGNGGSHKSMHTQAKQLAKKRYRVYSLDSRGQGANAPLEEYHYADMAEDTYQFIKALGIEKPAVYGWSDGGILALMLEMNHPGTSSMIALSGANLYPDCGDGFEEFKTWILENQSPLTMMMLVEPNINPAELNAIPCPALVTAGTEDFASVEHTKLIADSIPCGELLIVEGANHGNYIKRNPRMGKYLIDFLERHGYANPE